MKHHSKHRCHNHACPRQGTAVEVQEFEQADCETCGEPLIRLGAPKGTETTQIEVPFLYNRKEPEPRVAQYSMLGAFFPGASLTPQYTGLQAEPVKIIVGSMNADVSWYGFDPVQRHVYIRTQPIDMSAYTPEERARTFQTFTREGWQLK